MKTLVFFNNKGGVGKTSLIYHLAWMYAELGLSVIAADFDPQSNLTTMFLDEERLEKLWPDEDHSESVLGAISPILKGTGDIKKPHIERINEKLGLIVGDLGLSSFEDSLSEAWPKCHDGKEAAFRIISAFYRLVTHPEIIPKAELALIDVGPNLGAINRAAIIASDYIAIPLAPDLYSLQGLKNLGPFLQQWRKQWNERLNKNPADKLTLPKGVMKPIGYVIMQHAIRSDRPVRAYSNWMNRIPGEYRSSVKKEPRTNFDDILDDNYCLALLKHYRSLMPMAMEVRKPMFHLKPADGAIGAHMAAVLDCHRDFKELAIKIATLCGIDLPINNDQ